MGVNEYTLVATDCFGVVHSYTFKNEDNAIRAAYEWKHVNAQVKVLKNGDTIYEHVPN